MVINNTELTQKEEQLKGKAIDLKRRNKMLHKSLKSLKKALV